jgi:hypothetical protein
MKKFPSIIKLPHHRDFSYEPRFYDPVKEDIENRKALIASSLRRQKKLNLRPEDDVLGHHSRISLAFQRKERVEKRSFIIQLFIVVILLLLFGAFFMG